MPCSIRGLVIYPKVIATVTAPKTSTHRNWWTEEQADLLRLHYRRMPIGELERRLKRTRHEIWGKAQRLGLTDGKKVKR